MDDEGGQTCRSPARVLRAGHQAMALSSTIFVVDVDLADADRNVYETLSGRMMRLEI